MTEIMETQKFLGLDCVPLTNERLSLLITKSVGPRIISLRLNGGENLLAEVPDFTLECPGVGTYHLWGGHRLWHAPEQSSRTYLPDDEPVTIVPVENGLEVTAPVEEETKLQKSLRITLPGSEGARESATIIVDHTITNLGLWDVELAPWAITQLKPGGLAILPMPTQPTDTEALQANRVFVIWPYTDVNSEHIHWGNQFTFVTATMENGALKLGFPNPRGWMAYHQERTLFVKKAPFDPFATYYEFGSSSQCYCGPQFLELETLGPRAQIAPGDAVTHREVWQLFSDVDFTPGEAAARELATRFELDANEP